MCLSLEDPSSGSFLPRTCTHLFSFERAVPYEPEVVKEVVKEVQEEISNEISGVVSKAAWKTEVSDQKTVRDLQKVLEDTRHFVRDDFSKVERALGEGEQEEGEQKEGEQEEGDREEKQKDGRGGASLKCVSSGLILLCFLLL